MTTPLNTDLMLSPEKYLYTHGINALVAYYLFHLYIFRQDQIGDELRDEIVDWFNAADEFMPEWALEVIDAVQDVE